MAGPNDTFPAQRRQAVIDQFTAAIQSAPPARKTQLTSYLSSLQVDLQGMTGLEASERIIRAINEMKAISE